MGSRLALALAACVPACIAPSVLDSSGRAVAAPSAPLVWRTALADDFDGLFESVRIEGEAAASLWKLYYHFARDGSYTGAALVIAGAQPEFQTLSGRWTIDAGRLDLGDGQAIEAQADGEHLRLSSEGGVAVLRRVEVE
jgi:hypothetical protein